MATPSEHAKASASASHRWLNCTAAPTFEAQFPDEDPGEYARAGTLAHSFCETVVSYNLHQITKRQFTTRWNKLKKNELYDPEMEKTAEFYQHYVFEKQMSFEKTPHVALEVRVDFSDYVPQGFGTCDCLLIDGDTLAIIDYKHGKGVPVDAHNNSQMRLYALGALKKYEMFYNVKTVSMSIVQPRITEDVSEETITADELRTWGEQIKPIAEKAVTGIGAEFKEGPWCRFCKGKAVCRARSENMTALDDFRSIPIEGKLTDQERDTRAQAAAAGFTVSPVLTDAEIGELLYKGEQLTAWYNDLKDYALSAILIGKDIPGWKAVEGKSSREWDDADKAFDDIIKAGYVEEMLYDRKPKTLAQVDKMMGKKEFAEIVGSHVVKPMGKPTLVDLSDKREPYSTAAADFQGATQP